MPLHTHRSKETQKGGSAGERVHGGFEFVSQKRERPEKKKSYQRKRGKEKMNGLKNASTRFPQSSLDMWRGEAQAHHSQSTVTRPLQKREKDNYAIEHRGFRQT
jgi:hypothetical protein